MDKGSRAVLKEDIVLKESSLLFFQGNLELRPACLLAFLPSLLLSLSDRNLIMFMSQ